MTLKQNFLFRNLLLVAGLLIVAGVSVWRLQVLRGYVTVSNYAYTELKTAENTAVHLATARGLLAAPEANRPQVVEHLRSAEEGLKSFIEGPGQYVRDEEAERAYVRINARHQPPQALLPPRPISEARTNVVARPFAPGTPQSIRTSQRQG